MKKHLDVAGWVLAVPLILAACGGGTTAPAPGQSPVDEGVAVLEPIGESGVSGEATLRLDTDSRVLAVTVRLEGVEGGVTYSSQITPGCGRASGHIHKLDDLAGGSDGTVSMTTEVADVAGIDVDGGWAIKVGRPPGGTPGGGPQACGEVTAP